MIDNYKLWQDFKEDNDKKAREELISEYIPLVKYQAGRVKMIVPQFVEKDDLEGFGVIGLLDAVEKFDYTRGIKFTTYASRRIRGEIIDHLRRLDWLPHSMRRDGKKLKRVVEKLKSNLERQPTVEEISKETDLSKNRINILYYKLYSAHWVSLDKEIGDSGKTILEAVVDNKKSNPDKVFQKNKMIELLSDAIDRLAKKERLVVSLYYYDEMTQTEIAEIMNLSEARISQLHKKAIYRLRGFLSRKKEQLI